jgi:hypothetical protein
LLICSIEPPPPLVAPTPPGACVPVPGRIQRELRPKLTKKFKPTVPGATLAVSFDCDVLGGVAEIVYEVGSGHGQDLSLIRLQRREDRFEALRIQRPPMFSSAARPALIERGDLHASAVDALLPALRGLVLAKLEQREPPDSTSGSGFFSSNDWHGALRLKDAAGHVIERAFTGYESSAEQLRSIAMAGVVELLDPVVDRIPWQPAPADANVRSFFVERFLSAGPERAEWWVKERLVKLAEHAGTPALVPKLVALATNMGADASVQRTREHAVDALAALAGFDARRDALGKPAPLNTVTEAYARACRR